jgi:Uma2 family endonuclease
MSGARQHQSWTQDDFLAWEGVQEDRYEFNGIDPVAMVGASLRHHRIVRNGETALRSRLNRCEVFRETVKLRMAHAIRYPDLMVVCAPVASNATYVEDPVVVIEVLSEGSAGEDRITKNEEYRDTPAIMHYVMIEQDRIGATVFSRIDGDWRGRIVRSDNAVLAFPEIGIEVPLSAFYDGMEFGSA